MQMQPVRCASPILKPALRVFEAWSRSIGKSLLLCFLSLFALVAIASAAEHESKSLRVGVFENPPFIFINDRGEADGLYVDLLRHIAELEHWELDWIDGSWTSCLARLEQGELDIVASAAYTDERGERFDYTDESVYSFWTEVYAKQQSNIHSFEDLKNKTIGLMKDDVNAEYFVNKMQALEIPFIPRWADSSAEVFNLIEKGKVDAGVSSNTFAYFDSDGWDLRATGLSIYAFDVHYITLKGKNSDVIETLNFWLRKYKHDKDSIYFELLRKWTRSEMQVHNHLPVWFWNGLGGLLILIALLSLNGLYLKRAVKRASIGENEAKIALEDEFQKVKDSTEYLEAAMRGSNIVIWDYDLIRRKLKYSPNLVDMMGYSMEQLGDDFNFILEKADPKDRELVLQKTAELRAGVSKSINLDAKFIAANGEWKWVNSRGKIVDYEDGIPSRLIGTYYDVSARKQAEFELRKNEAKYRLLYTYLPVPYMCLDRDGLIVDVNPQWEKVMACKKTEAVGTGFVDFISPISIQDWRKALKSIKSLTRFNGFELKMLPRSGGLIEASFEGFCVSDEFENPHRVYLTFNDVTRQRRSERSTIEALNRLELAVEAARISIAEWWPAEDEYKHDRRLGKLLGYSKDKVLFQGASFCSELVTFVHPDDLEALNSLLEAMKGGMEPFAERLLRLVGNKHQDYWFRVVAKRKSRRSSSRVMVLFVDEDVKTRADLAQREAEERILKSEKMATLGTLSSGIAHEINNPNQMILSNTEFLEACLPEISELMDARAEEAEDMEILGIPIQHVPEELRKSFRNIRGGCSRIRTIVSELKDYVRQKDYDFERVDINRIVYSAQTLTSHLGKLHTDRFDWYSQTDLFVWGNAQKLEQVFVNILINAYESLTDKKQKVLIETYASEEGRVVVRIVDEGVGIPDEILNKITDPFFTTKQSVGGTGMGLSVVANIIKEHNADMRFQKNLPRGTEVLISFPRIESHA